jgi:hypothetical protein
VRRERFGLEEAAEGSGSRRDVVEEFMEES